MAVIPFNPSAPVIHPQFFPSPDTYRYDNTYVRFSVSCVAYLAKTVEGSPEEILVKLSHCMVQMHTGRWRRLTLPHNCFTTD